MKPLNTKAFHIDFKQYFTYGSAMVAPIEALTALVSETVGRLESLRADVARLEAALRERPVPPPETGGSRLAEENRRLREERALVLERVRGIIREIDRAL